MLYSIRMMVTYVKRSNLHNNSPITISRVLMYLFYFALKNSDNGKGSLYSNSYYRYCLRKSEVKINIFWSIQWYNYNVLWIFIEYETLQEARWTCWNMKTSRNDLLNDSVLCLQGKSSVMNQNTELSLHLKTGCYFIRHSLWTSTV